MTDAGFEKFVPEARPPAGALRDALDTVCGGPRTLIRPLKTKDGFTVVTETRGDTENQYETSLTATIDPGTNRIRFTPTDERAWKIVEEFNKHLGLLRQHQVSNALVEMLGHLGGTRLRPTGAIYWLPDNRLEEWRRVAQAVELASLNRPSAVYLVSHPLNADAVRAVRDAIVAEVSTEATSIKNEVLEGNLGERALENRRLVAEQLRAKIGLYEQLLDTGLADLRRAVEEADDAAAAAVLLAGAAAANGEGKQSA
jgi:hypothetical protein